ncbi:hypothetical protein B7Z17_04640, partial [Candidatus Saccharibacteria bacterium 32-49-10]
MNKLSKLEPINILVYRWRYVIGFVILVAIFAITIAMSGLYAPGGLSQAEIDTIDQTLRLTQEGIHPVNAIFHTLQLASFKLFGVSILSIK